MLIISVQPDQGGFWYLIDIPGNNWFTLEFFAIGPGGHLIRDEVSGRTDPTPGWVFYPSDFPILRVGIVECQIVPVTTSQPVQSAPSSEFAQPIRQKIAPAVFTRLFTQQPDATAGLEFNAQYLRGRTGRRTTSRDVPYSQDIPYSQSIPYSQHIPYAQEIPYLQHIPYSQDIPYSSVPHSPGFGSAREFIYPQKIGFLPEHPYPEFPYLPTGIPNMGDLPFALKGHKSSPGSQPKARRSVKGSRARKRKGKERS